MEPSVQVTPSLVHVSWPLKGPGGGDPRCRSTGTFGRRPPGVTAVQESPLPAEVGSPARWIAVRARAPIGGQPLLAPPQPGEIPGHEAQKRQE